MFLVHPASNSFKVKTLLCLFVCLSVYRSSSRLSSRRLVTESALAFMYWPESWIFPLCSRCDIVSEELHLLDRWVVGFQLCYDAVLPVCGKSNYQYTQQNSSASKRERRARYRKLQKYLETRVIVCIESGLQSSCGVFSISLIPFWARNSNGEVLASLRCIEWTRERVVCQFGHWSHC